MTESPRRKAIFKGEHWETVVVSVEIIRRLGYAATDRLRLYTRLPLLGLLFRLLEDLALLQASPIVSPVKPP